ncbi:glycoside hydrolase family 3 C-terminal domain-containing protein [Lachnospiraceae bacterium OttesenSCG-928-D06]|nr:glycoside hydrolase family 3 C-terminal domain-containing protein [Lachnospiraceae bacterium OttesenSCG-928-D06]
MQQYEKNHLTLVLENAAECTVLLKSNGQFPINKPGKLAAFGAGLRYTIKGGTGSGEVNTRFTYTIEEGLEKEGFEITSKKWLDDYDKVRINGKKQFIKDLKAEAKAKKEKAFMYAMGKAMKEPNHKLELAGDGDVAIYVVSRISGEGSDREVVEGDVKLAKSEIRDILALNKKYNKFMLVINVGGVVDLSDVMEVENILLLSQLGVDCGKVLADILTGKQNPSGKLTTTWAAWNEYSKEGSFGDWNDTNYNEGIYVGYRYFDTFKKKALFPFGYGLSYTSFEQSVDSVRVVGETVNVKVNVKNTGSCVGKEVVQVYVSLPKGKLDKAYQELAGFAKTSLIAVGGSYQVEVSFNLSDLASYDEEIAAYVLDAGEYIVRVGNSSVSTRIAAIITLNEEVVTLKTRNCLGSPGFTDMKARVRDEEKINEEVVKIVVNASDVKTKDVIYHVDYEIDERVKSLSDEELAFLQIGNFNPNAKGLSIIGNAAIHVAGAAGETTSQLADKGIKPLIMADGPAGIRVARQYYEDNTGAHSADGAGIMPESILEMMGPVARFVAKLITGGAKVPKNVVIKEHMATMIPIGTAIAQSFNLDLARALGDLVGREMEMMGIHLWLAPALNIHRSILCGRNFEYYSEDPLVSGKITAAITEGVQTHKGCGTTIKHYAANNAETNRYCNNSHVSERAMREIYLRGFGIAVRESQPKAVMTSYNLLNGTHTAEHRGLIEDVLRCEFGFKGIVMTDWVIAVMTSGNSTYRNTLSNEVAKAGGDLFMPGGRADYDNVMNALKDGSLSREQLEMNGTRVIRMVDQMPEKIS